MIFCVDYGSKLHFATCKRFDSTQDHYRCSQYKGNIGSYTVFLSFRKLLEKNVLSQIFEVTAMMYDNADKFFNLVAKQQFHEIVKKYVGIKELTPIIVNEFIKKIIVHAPDKSNGHRVQKIQIIFNFIGEFTP